MLSVLALAVTVLLWQLTVDVISDMFLQLCTGLRHLHACGVLHRDLRADNVLVASLQPLVLRIADFGCSVKLGADTVYGKGQST